MTFEDCFREDFIYTMINHYEMTENKAKEVWEEFVFRYIDRIYSKNDRRV